jgi:lysophospholipase L1-like esterase
MIGRFHPALPWPVRIDTALRLGWIWATVPRLPAPPAPAGFVGGRQPGLTVLGIGDSIIAGIGVETQSESLVAKVATQLAFGGREVRWASAGVSGASAAALDRLFEMDVPYPPDLLLLSCGVNDVVRGRPAAEIGAALTGFYRQAHGRWPEARIVHVGIPPLDSFPALGARLGRLLGTHGLSCVAAARNAALASGAIYADFPESVTAAHFARDGFHPNAAGCAAWAVAVARIIDQSGPLCAAHAPVASR